MTCTHNATTGGLRTTDLEFLTMEHSMDTEVTTLRTVRRASCAGGQTFDCSHSNTHQEFSFSEYLKDRQPQLIVIFANSHDIRRRKLSRLSGDFAYLVGVVQQHVPQSTTVLWVPLHDHAPAKYPGGFRNFTYGRGRYSASQQITNVNRVWFEVLKPHFLG